ncbi:MAG: tetratricopeptide repeat protein [Elusimicrobia bacterium]|nr:tetratricopeptide repeat protein [Elusimicrobiota bacterium]
MQKEMTTVKQKILLVIFGLCLTVILLEAGLRIAGFIYLSLQEYRNIVSLKQKGTYRIMCLGESTTASGGKYSYPSQLQRILNQNDAGLKFSVINKGIIGTDTSVIVSRLEYNLSKYKPDMVVTMMGINDERKYIVPYKDTATSKVMQFFKSFRTYKLVKLLYLHIINKAEEMGVYKQEEIEEDIDLETDIPIQLTGFRERKRMYKDAIEVNPENDKAYVKLGWCYKKERDYGKAEEMFGKAVEINPNNDEAYIGLGWCYKKYYIAKEIFNKAIKINPRNYLAYIGLGTYYRDKGENDKAEKMFNKAIEINPRNYLVYVKLGWGYIYRREYNKAEEIFIKAIKMDPKNDRLYGGLARCYKKQGKDDLAMECFRKANELRLEYYNPITHHNYQRLVEILTQREIEPVCVQYPMRSVEQLKKMLEPYKGIVFFVDNEMVFKKAVEQAGYNKYFKDMFGGSFGHCTPIGNGLLAENIASVILNECFNK